MIESQIYKGMSNHLAHKCCPIKDLLNDIVNSGKKLGSFISQSDAAKRIKDFIAHVGKSRRYADEMERMRIEDPSRYRQELERMRKPRNLKIVDSENEECTSCLLYYCGAVVGISAVVFCCYVLYIKYAFSNQEIESDVLEKEALTSDDMNPEIVIELQSVNSYYKPMSNTV